MSLRTTSSVPNEVKNFVADLYEASRQRHNADEVQRHYEAFKQYSDKYFSQAKWPNANLIAEECGDDEVFLTFYNEMASRHLFTKQKRGVISLDDYIDSWHNYREIFDHILSQRGESDAITLTPQWAYDIVQEFVYQFQGFCQYRAQAAGRKDDELEELRQQSDVWALSTVVKYLRSLISRGNVRAALSNRREQGFLASSDSAQAVFLLGYFSITELSRLMCLIGNYEDALEVLEPLSLGDRDELYTQVLLCNINVFYHTGICFLMLRRYTDAIAVFGDLVALSSRVAKPGLNVRDPSIVMVQKLSEKTLSLLAIAMTLCPGCTVDEQIRQMLTEKIADRMRRLEQGDLVTFEDMFVGASPKFVTPSEPDYSNPASVQSTIRQQTNTFMEDVRQQVGFGNLRAYLRLYSTIELKDFARFNDSDETTVLHRLLSYQRKLSQVQRLEESGAGVHQIAHTGTRKMASDVHYFINNHTLHVDDSSVRSTVEGFYMAGIHKHAKIVGNLDSSFKRLLA